MSPPREPRPPFPAWLARRDPLLAAAAANPLYDAFARWRAQRRVAIDWVAAAVQAMPWAALVAAVLLVPFVGGFCCLLPLLPLGAYLLAAWVRRRPVHATSMPDTLTGTLSPMLKADVFQDLWLTPATPQQWGEALVLEGRGGNHRTAMAIWVLVLLAATAVYLTLASLLRAGGRPILGDGAFVLCLAGAAVMLMHPTYWLLNLLSASDTQSALLFVVARRKVRAAWGALGSSALLLAGTLTGLVILALMAASGAVFFWGTLFAPLIEWVARIGDNDTVGRVIGARLHAHLLPLLVGVTLLLVGLFGVAVGVVLRAWTRAIEREIMETAARELPRVADSILDPR